MRRKGQSQYGYELYDAYAAIGMAGAWRALAQLAGVMLLICPVVMEGKLSAISRQGASPYNSTTQFSSFQLSH